MKEELIGGLKNAIERGEPLEKAIQSFINSGYNATEVRAAAAELKKPGVTSILHPEESEGKEEEKEEKPKEEVKKLPAGKEPEPKKRDMGKTILIIGLILVALGSIGAILAIILLK